MNIYVGSLPREMTEEELRKAFEAFGQVSTVSILKDKFTGEPRGFGFVEMPTKAEGEAAITGLNGKEFNGRKIVANEARPRSNDGRGGGSGGYGGGGGRRGGGGGGYGGGGGGGRRDGGGGGRRFW